MLIGGFTTVLMNVNPLIPLDGYYALSDWLEVPNLRQRAFAHLAWLIKTKLLRLDVPAPPADEREQRIFTIYSLLAAGYICSIFLFIGAVVYGWIGRCARRSGRYPVRGPGVADRPRSDPGMEPHDSRRRPAGEGATSVRAAGTGARCRAAAWRLLGVLVPARITVTGPFTVAPSSSVALVAADSGLVFEVWPRGRVLVADQGTLRWPGSGTWTSSGRSPSERGRWTAWPSARRGAGTRSGR